MKFDAYELNAVQEMDGFCEPVYDIKDQKTMDEINRETPENETYFWTVYGHLPEGGVNAIADFSKLDDAEWLYNELMFALEKRKESKCLPISTSLKGPLHG